MIDDLAGSQPAQRSADPLDRGDGALCQVVAPGCPYRKLCPLAQSRESGDAPTHEGYAQIDLVGSHRALQIASLS